MGNYVLVLCLICTFRILQATSRDGYVSARVLNNFNDLHKLQQFLKFGKSRLNLKAELQSVHKRLKDFESKFDVVYQRLTMSVTEQEHTNERLNNKATVGINGINQKTTVSNFKIRSLKANMVAKEYKNKKPEYQISAPHKDDHEVSDEHLDKTVESKISTSVRQKRTQLSGNVTFSATLTVPIRQNYDIHRRIVFDKVWSNQGNGYDNRTGNFTAPVHGVYAFYFGYLESQPNELHTYDMILEIVRDGTSMPFSLRGIWTPIGFLCNTALGSNYAMFEVNRGSKVWLRSTQMYTDIEGIYPVIFSGCLRSEM